MDVPEDNSAESNNSSRWTCEACGCITNCSQENPTSCSICGSARQIPDILRRDEPLSSQLLRRSFFVRRGGGGLDFQRSFNPRNLEQIENDMVDEEEEDEHAVAALALEVAGVADAARIPGARSRRDMLIRSVQDNVPFGLDSITSPALAPDELLEISTENASLYDPQWESPTNLGMRRKNNSLIVGDDEYANVATLPIGATEGKSIRALQQIPRVSAMPDGTSLRRKAFGFRITFKRPFRDTGKSLGGGYLVGITTGSFTSFDERNSLQQSSLFWGIDDNGHKYEGGSDNVSIRGSRRSHHGVEMSARQVARNEDNVLYGCLETITVVVDMESRTLTFWRDDDILGTLVRNIPRSGALYPVAVPFNSGAIVAITGLDGSPVSRLQRYEAFMKEKNIAKEKARHQELCQQRSLLVRSGKPTDLLEAALRQLFSLYSSCDQPTNVQLGVISAARLWYRSGLKLTHLSEIIESKITNETCLFADAHIVFEDFYDVICSVLVEDESLFSEIFDCSGDDEWESSNREQFEVGDIVELVEGYEKYGDAARGPMVPGDRGQVVEVQQGSSGERHSIRVVYNGRRWWYQPQTLLAEKSALIATPAIWFVQRILRSHGYDHISLVPMWGQPVTNSSWLVGDIVVPAVDASSMEDSNQTIALASINGSTAGRIVPPSALSGSQGLICDRGTGIVCVEFVDNLFGVRVGLSDSEGDERASRVHRVNVKDLRHAGFSQMVDEESMDDVDKASRNPDSAASPSLPKDIVSVSKLDVQAIESVAKECEKSEGALARVFASGLPVAVFNAVDLGRKIVRNNEDQSNLLPAIAALGNLLTITARHLYGETTNDAEPQDTHEAADTDIPSPGSQSGLQLPPLVPASRFGGSFGLFRGNSNDNQVQNLGLRNQMSALSRRIRDRTGIPPFGSGSQTNNWVRLAAEAQQQETNIPSSQEAIFLSGSSQRTSGPLKLHSPTLHSVRRGGFEAILPGEDARRGAPVLNAATKSTIANGILSNNYIWFNKVVETAKRRKGSSSTTSSLVNAQDEDGMPLLVLSISLGCSASIVSYLIRNGATVDNDVVRKAAYLGQKDMLSQLLAEHVYVEGMLDRDACSQEVMDTIESATKRQNDHEEALHREGEEFLSTVIRALIRFGNECRCCLAPKTHIYRSITQILVGRVLLRALHLNRLNFLPSATSRSIPAKPKSPSDSESGRVNIFPDNESVAKEKDSAPSSIASSEGLLFVLPVEILVRGIFKKFGDPYDCPLTDYLLLLEGLLWTKEVEDIALGLTLTAILLRAAPLDGYAVALQRFGIVDLTAVHERESEKRLEAFDQSKGPLNMDSRRFSSHHVAAREQEVKKLLSAGVVLCPKCHPAELHLTRHSSFRCDLCGNGVDRGFPMHGCRECDWDACEDCINMAEGGIVKWKHVQCLSQECGRLLTEVEKCDSSEPVKAELSAKDWSLQMMSARIKALDTDVLKEFLAQLLCPGALTMFEFSNYLLPVLHGSLCGGSTKHLSPEPTYDPPKKKQRPQFRSISGNVVDRHAFLDKAAITLILEPVSESLNAQRTDHESEQCSKQPPLGETDSAPGDENAVNAKTIGESPKHLTRHTPELLRRLHEVLSFCEDFPTSKNILAGTKETSEDLQSLTKPWAIEVFQSGGKPFVVNCEPLMQLSDLKDHLLRSTSFIDPSYVSYCQSLAEDQSIIAESPGRKALTRVGDAHAYRLAKVVDFDSETGAHTIKYASKIVRDVPPGERCLLDPELVDFSESILFDGAEESVLLGCRHYVVLQRFKNAKRDEYKSIVQNVLKSQDILENSTSSFPAEALPRGTRVERASKPHTIIGCSHPNHDDSLSRRAFIYDLVSDDGEVLRGVTQHEIKSGFDQDSLSSRARLLRERVGASARDRSSRMIALRGLGVGDEDADQPPLPRVGILKRTWSALSLLDELSPVDLNACQKNGGEDNRRSSIKCSVGGVEADTVISASCVEKPPQFRFQFGLNDSQPPVDLGSRAITLVSAFQQLSEKQDTHRDSKTFKFDHRARLYFRIDFVRDSASLDNSEKTRAASAPFQITAARAANLSEEKESLLSLDPVPPVLPGMDDVMEEVDNRARTSRLWTDESEKLTVNCMQLIDSIGRYVYESGMTVEASERPEAKPSPLYDVVDASLESRSLTNKLSEQLDQSLAVASGALPSWCTELPSLAPRLFSYDSRRQLLERTAFGVSRATMRLQEAKVSVGPLRQRMAALRGRAVELVGEAFSGGAEDPTALQLQADELYGMEEALGARVNAAFRAQRWHERSLQCAKAAVRRDTLLLDAATVMERYASDNMFRQRRLEVRFCGESGFDAASGDEAGVTRGFYADVAEALLSCQHVSSSTCDSVCSPRPSATPMQTDPVLFTAADYGTNDSKLPLWVPDVDASGTVIIPTPRASAQSTPGVYPRPLSPQDPKMAAVKAQFRFIGRVFACAIREGFMFPLPLSCSFLRLVQICASANIELSSRDDYADTISEKPLRKLSSRTASPSVEDDASDEYSYEENTPTTGTKSLSDFHGDASRNQVHGLGQGLVSLDLPRPGFFGGEIFAVEHHICEELDRIDAMDLREAESEKRYLQVAANRKFAQNAFGKSYECSFEEYMEGKTFVDPLDASQGPGATPLCPDGHERDVTVFNVREWVGLAKQFILRDGVLEQAKAFQQGINDFFPTEYLRLFTATELQRDVCGGSDRVDEWTEDDIKKLFKMDGAKGATEALVAVAAMGGEGGATLSRRFGSSSPTIGYLIKTLLKSTTTQRRQFLNFVTSVPIVTPGEIEVVPIVSPSGDFLPLRDNCLPRANTCARRLYLPKFESYEKFSSVLWSVIREESKFKGFYEWRGSS